MKSLRTHIRIHKLPYPSLLSLLAALLTWLYCVSLSLALFARRTAPAFDAARRRGVAQLSSVQFSLCFAAVQSVAFRICNELDSWVRLALLPLPRSTLYAASLHLSVVCRPPSVVCRQSVSPVACQYCFWSKPSRAEPDSLHALQAVLVECSQGEQLKPR